MRRHFFVGVSPFRTSPNHKSTDREPDGGVWARRWLAVAAGRERALAVNLAIHPDEPDGGGGCALVSGRCCIWIRFGQAG
jgi:hypothetical protein